MNTVSISRAIQALVITTSLVFASLAIAEPSRQEIDQALMAGNGAKAEMLLKEVLAAHPDSAKAHFKYSEVLAAEGRLAEAKTELSKAETIEPGLAFAKPEAVNNLKHKIFKTKQSIQTSNAGSATNPLLKWAGIAFVVFLIVMVFRSFRRPQTQPNYANNSPVPNGYAPQNPYPPQGGYSPQGGAGGMGSGIMGGLATGAAVGAGIVAGEMLMHKVMDGDHSNTNTDSGSANNPSPTTDFSDITGNEFVDSDNGSWGNDSSLGDSSSFDSDNSGDWS
jgi:hypothetical protein